jgi:hypothetical protein
LAGILPKIYSLQIEAYQVKLVVNLKTSGGEITQIEYSGELLTNKQAVTFEIGEKTPLLTNRTYVLIERLFLDIYTAGYAITPSLSTVDPTATIAGTAINNAVRTSVYQDINRKGRLLSLTLAGDFTKAIALRRIELDCRIPNGRE